jgi:hypothetical protein
MEPESKSKGIEFKLRYLLLFYINKRRLNLIRSCVNITCIGLIEINKYRIISFEPWLLGGAVIGT